MSPRIHELLARGGTLDTAAVDAFLAANHSPIVEGPSVTFLFRGEADQVNLRHAVFGLRSIEPFQRVPGTDLWYALLEVPEGSRIEYKLEVIRGDRRQWIRDPMNPHFARDPFGANSVCQCVGYETPTWTQHDPLARTGTYEDLRIDSAALGMERDVQVYLPARLRSTRRYPLLIAFDGPEYLRYAALGTVLDNLMHAHEMAPVIVALCRPGDRMREYTGDEAHARFVLEELVPQLESRFPVRTDPRERGLMGASLGGVAALSAAWRHPGSFGRLLLQSGSFAFTDVGEIDDQPVFAEVAEFVNEFRAAPGRPAERLFVSCGMYEPLIYQNRSLVALLQGTDLDLRYVEARDGHNWENWRDRLRDGLTWLYPGPIGLIYD